MSGTPIDPAREFYRKRSKVFTYTPVIDTNAYAAGDSVGAVTQLSSIVNADGFGGFIHSVTVIEAATTTLQKERLDLIFFNSQPSASTFTNNAAISIAAADKDKVIGTLAIADTDYVDISGTNACGGHGARQRAHI